MTDLSSGSQDEVNLVYAGSSRQSRVYTWDGCFEGAYAYTCGFDVLKVRMHIHALSCKRKRIYVGNLTLGPWQFVLGI